MIIALALVAGAFLAGWVVPGWLRRLDPARRDPGLLIVVWLMAMVGFLLAVAVGIALLVTPGHGTVGALAGLEQCWHHLSHGSTPHAEQWGGLLGAVLLAAVAVRLVSSVTAELRRVRSVRQERLDLLQLAARVDNGGTRTLWLEHDRPLAFSLPGRPGVIVATEGLRRHLSPSGVAAVLAHEHAHLRGRHHLLTTITGVVCRMFRFVPLFRDGPAVLRDLFELAADAQAVREHGFGALDAALRVVSRQSLPANAMAVGQDAVDVRLARLALRPRQPDGARRAIQCGAAGFAAVVLPLATGGTFLFALAMLGCPTELS